MSEFLIRTPVNTEVDFSNNDYFYLTDIDHQTYFNSSIYSVNNVGNDGDTINSISVNPRKITFTVIVKSSVDVEDAKRYIFTNLKPKKTHTIVWNRNGRELIIEGIFETASFARWKRQVIGTLSFYCGNPYWMDQENVVQRVSDVEPAHYFTTYTDDMLFFEGDGIVMGEYNLERTRSYQNFGDVDTGLTIEIHILRTAVNPIIYSTPTSFIGINGTFETGDVITITTEHGKKNIIKNGVSIINQIKQGSTFLQMGIGLNSFAVTTDDGDTGNLYFVISYRQKYI